MGSKIIEFPTIVIQKVPMPPFNDSSCTNTKKSNVVENKIVNEEGPGLLSDPEEGEIKEEGEI
ncbi:hypothetical protein HMI55_004540 [Coelomomyces lativittatus]|nr:hypothetical protein HMI55_004540 [Coelomomyces lativittatus]KAJ1503532.1 hypothetical protein HMI56_002089 [Coelomomyces lativittatus]